MSEKSKAHLDEALRIIFYARNIERNVLANQLNLSPVIVSRILQKLLNQQKIMIVGKGKSTGGRKPEIFAINPEWGNVIGVTFTSRGIMSATSSPAGKMEHLHHYDFSPSFSKTQTMDTIYRAISDQIIYLHKKNRKIFCIGIGLSGLVDERLGISINFPRYELWQDVPIGTLVNEKFDIKTVVSNNVTAATLSENIFGEYRDATNALYFHMGPGLGLGIIVSGSVYRGSRLNIGEFGHTTVGGENNKICYCGSYGCLESVASAEALVSEARAALKKGASSSVLPEYIAPQEGKKTQGDDDSHRNNITATAIFKAAADGDRLAFHLVERAARSLGIGIANMVNIFAPEVIILGGMMVEESELLLDLLNNTLRARALQKIGEDMDVVTSSFGKHEGIMGTISLAWVDFFEDINNNS